MNQSQIEAQAKYRADQAAATAATAAAKQPINDVYLLTLRDIDNMSSDVYRVHVQTNPAFVIRVNELEATRPPRQR